MRPAKVIPFPVIPFPSHRRDRGPQRRASACKLHVLERRQPAPKLAVLPLLAIKELVLCAARVVGA